MSNENNAYTVKSMILDLANLKDLNSNAMKNNTYDIIKDILSYAENEIEDETLEAEIEDINLAKEFSEEFIKTVIGIANDILINADNSEDSRFANIVNKEDESDDKELEPEFDEIEVTDEDDNE